MLTKTPRKRLVLALDALKVQSLVMPASQPVRAVTTSQTCPTKCDTEWDCSNGCEQTQQANCTLYC